LRFELLVIGPPVKTKKAVTQYVLGDGLRRFRWPVVTQRATAAGLEAENWIQEKGGD
jgi:hypothetical protein